MGGQVGAIGGLIHWHIEAEMSRIDGFGDSIFFLLSIYVFVSSLPKDILRRQLSSQTSYESYILICI